MRYLNGCTECHTIYWACRCPNRCEECGCGFRDDSTCGTPGCRAGERRARAIMAQWEDQRRAEASAAIQCEAVTDPAPVAEAETATAETTPARPMAETARPVKPAPRPRGGVQNGQAKAPGAKAAARPSSPPEGSRHRPVAERRAAVEALLSDGLSDRAIARAVKVSPSTVAAVRRDRVNVLH